MVLNGCLFVPFKVDGRSGPSSSTQRGAELSPLLVERLSQLDDYNDVNMDAFIEENVASFKTLDEAGHSFFLSLLCRKVGIDDDATMKSRWKSRVSQAIARSVQASS